MHPLCSGRLQPAARPPLPLCEATHKAGCTPGTAHNPPCALVRGSALPALPAPVATTRSGPWSALRCVSSLSVGPGPPCPSAPRGGSLRCGRCVSVSRRSLRSLCCLIGGLRPRTSHLPPLRPCPPRRGGLSRGRPCGRPAERLRGSGRGRRFAAPARAAGGISSSRGRRRGVTVARCPVRCTAGQRPRSASAPTSPARRASDPRADAAGEA